jgi:hypothetical protein
MSILERMTVFAVRLALAALLAQGAPAGGLPVVDRAVASVEGQVITQTELELEARLALIARGAVTAASAPLDDQALRGALDLVIGKRLQLAEADRLRAAAVSGEEVETAVKALRGRFPSQQAYDQFLSRHDADPQLIATLVGGSLRAERFLDSKLRLRAQVSEGEVRAYYQQHAERLGGSYADWRLRLREKLFRERYAQLAAQELAQMRRAADVRLIAPFTRVQEALAP